MDVKKPCGGRFLPVSEHLAGEMSTLAYFELEGFDGRFILDVNSFYTVAVDKALDRSGGKTVVK